MIPEQIALPALSPGAMENWGLITYQEEALFYEEEVASPLFKKEMIATIIAHELAHQVREKSKQKQQQQKNPV